MITSLIILANQVSGLYNEYTCMQSHINKETSRKSFDIKCNNSEGMQKMTKKWEEPSF